MDTVSPDSSEGVEETGLENHDDSCDDGFKLPIQPITFRVEGIFSTQSREVVGRNLIDMKLKKRLNDY